jgi:anti-sigma regulatory factor (Ser/Thr protein kinase)
MRRRFLKSIGTDPGEVEEVNSAFAGFAETHGVPANTRRNLNVALDELLANVLSHGMAGRDGGSVTVEVDLDQESLTLTLTDDGPPFDPFGQADPDTTLSVDDREIGGLGVHIVRRLVDDVSYERRDGRNVVTLVKRLAGGQADGPSGGK